MYDFLLYPKTVFRHELSFGLTCIDADPVSGGREFLDSESKVIVIHLAIPFENLVSIHIHDFHPVARMARRDWDIENQ